MNNKKILIITLIVIMLMGSITFFVIKKDKNNKQNQSLKQNHNQNLKQNQNQYRNDNENGNQSRTNRRFKAVYLYDDIYLLVEKNKILNPINIKGVNESLKIGDFIEFDTEIFLETYPLQTTIEDYDILEKEINKFKIDINEVEQLTSILKKITLIDVRTESEYNQGHLKNAELMPLDNLVKEIKEKYDTNTPLIVYCRSGNRSDQAQELLMENGYFVIDAGGVLTYTGTLEK